MSFNINALRVSVGGIVASFNTSPTTVGTAIVIHSLVVAGLVMLGAKIAALFGARSVFQATVVLFGGAMAIMALSPNTTMMILAQAVAGGASAALIPTLVVLIAANYRSRQQAQALGWLGASEAMGGVVAFLVAGSFGTWIGWRYPFGLLAALAAGVFVLSKQLDPVESQRDLRIDLVGFGLVALAIPLISIGFNSINRWGLLLAEPTAPFGVLGLSPAPVMIIVGIVLGQAFFAWSRRRQAAQKPPLMAPQVIERPQQRSAVFTMFMIVMLGSAVSFLIPLYIEIVQGRSSLETALAIIPYSLSIFFAAILVSRLLHRLSSRLIARSAFVMVAAALASLGVVVWKRVGNLHGDLRADRAWPRTRCAGNNSVQRPCRGFARGVGRRCGLAARHHQQSRRGRRHRDRRRAVDRRAERQRHEGPGRQSGHREGSQGAG
jgi:predicted MFS family arabinose efflux permease